MPKKRYWKSHKVVGIKNYDKSVLTNGDSLLYIPTPKSMYKNVHKLEPAHYLKIDVESNTFEKIKYWQLEVKKCDDDIETAKQKIYGLVKKSVDEQIVADVPVGFFLSGGMDSSTVVALASQEHNDINTFAIGFQDKQKDESIFAKKTSEYFKTKHLEKKLDDKSIELIFNDIVNWYDEPNALSSSYPSYYVAELAKHNSTVVLTGDGGDEVFGGYNWYKRFESLQKYSLSYLRFLKVFTKPLKKQKNILGKIARRFEALFLLNEMEIYTRLMGGMLKDEKEKYRKFWNIDKEYDDYWYFRKYYKKDYDLYTRLQYLDFHTFLPDACLAKVDRTSMAVSLECRVPFLSKEIIEYCFSLKDNVRLYNSELKGAMKETFKEILPSEIINRDKKGFSAPLKAVLEKMNLDEKFMQEKFLKKYWSIDNG